MWLIKVPASRRGAPRVEQRAFNHICVLSANDKAVKLRCVQGPDWLGCHFQPEKWDETISSSFVEDDSAFL